MNKVFAEHVTNTAFFLSMSKSQIGMLMAVVSFPWDEKHDANSCYSREVYSIVVGSMRDPVTAAKSLSRKGLIESVPHKFKSMRGDWVDHHHFQATKAGKLVADLLVEAGFVLPLLHAVAA